MAEIDKWDETLFGPRPKSKTWKGGYATQPGTGPANETCGTCSHFLRMSAGNSGWFFKCGLVRQHPCSKNTDIRKSAPACRYWKGATDGPAI